MKAETTEGQKAPRVRRGASGRPTIKAVASHAGVGIGTVSRVVNGERTSDAVRQRVLESIAQLGYAPSLAARGLATGRTGTVGLAVDLLRSPWFPQLLAGVEQALHLANESVLLASLDARGPSGDRAVLGWIRERRVDGLILVGCTASEAPLLDAARERGLPLVLVAPDDIMLTGPCVRCNERRAGELAVSHLHELGHTRIAFAGGPHSSLETRERLAGVREALASRGVAEPGETWFGTECTPEAGEAYAAHFLNQERSRRSTAVVLADDAMALGFARHLLRRGVGIPKDVSVVGFGGTPMGALFWPELTTVRRPVRHMAERACSALLSAMSGFQQESERVLESDVELVVRDSTGAPPN